jgi:hypothetical protein
MSKGTYSQELQAMIDRAGRLTAEEAAELGRLWKDDEEIEVVPTNVALTLVGEVDSAFVTNGRLVAAWEHALHAAGNAGRVDEIEAAQEAGRAAKRDLRHMHDDSFTKDGAEEAVRSAVLATGVRDLISEEDHRALTAAWTEVLGDATA